MTDVSPHDWLRPKLAALMKEAEAAGIAPDVSVAVITDLVNGALFTATPPEADENWNKDIGEPDEFVNQNEPLTAEPGVADPVPNPMAGVGRRGRY
jgi:hypothetical protein